MPEKKPTAKEKAVDKQPEQAPVEETAEGVEVVEEVAVQVNSNQALSNPAQHQRGMDDFESDDLILPRAILMQPLSPAVQDDEIEIKAGELLNNITNMNYGTTVTVIPAMFRKKRIKWYPRDDEGGIECASMLSGGRVPDTGEHLAPNCRKCKHSQWGKTKDEPPQCNIIYEFLCVVLDEDLGPENVMERIVAIGFTRTSAKAGQKMANLVKFGGGDIFSRAYKISTKKQQKDKYTWWEFIADPAGKITPGQFSIVESVFNMLDSTSFQVASDEDEPEFAEAEVDDGAINDGDANPF